MKEIKDAIKAMKKGKAAGCSGVSADMIKILEESGVDTMVDIIGTVCKDILSYYTTDSNGEPRASNKY